MTILSRVRPAQSESELLRTPEMDEEDAREAGVRLASDLSMTILAVADLGDLGLSEPARSQMILEANFFAAAFIAHRVGRWYSREALRVRFVAELKAQFTLVLALATDSMQDAAVCSGYDSLLADRQQQYQTMLVSRQPRRFRLFVREASVDKVFLAERIKFALSQHSVSVANSVVRHFVSRVVREVYSTSAAFTGSPVARTRSSRAMGRGKIGWAWMAVVGVVVVGVLSEQWRVIDKYFPALNRFIHSGTPTTQSDVEYLVARFLSDAGRLDTLCVPDISSLRDENDAVRFLKGCRVQMLSARPVLDDMHARFEPLRAGWDREKTERAVPAECRNDLDAVFANVGAYLSKWDEEIAMFESVDLDSAKREEVRKAARRMAELEQEEVAALTALKEADPKLASNSCQGY